MYLRSKLQKDHSDKCISNESIVINIAHALSYIFITFLKNHNSYMTQQKLSMTVQEGILKSFTAMTVC